MKRKLTSVLLASTLLLSSTYTFASEIKQDNDRQNISANEIVMANTAVAVNSSALEEAAVTNPLETVPKEETTANPAQAVSTDQTENPQNPDNSTLEEPALEGTVSQEQNQTNIGDSVTGTRQVILTLGSKEATVQGEKYMLNNPPTVIEGTTFLPLRFIGDQVLEADVVWDKETQTITVTKEGKEVTVRVGSKTATVDGQPVELLQAPVIENGTTMLPVKFMSQAFGIDTIYNKDTKQVIITATIDTTPNQQPVASFYFKEPTYTAGQMVEAVNTSTDPDGDKIISTEWCVTTTKTVTADDLNKIFKKPDAGTYYVGLRVKDARGAVSEWVYEQITILPNEKPVITSLSPNKSTYSQGETLNFSYNYDNESWESIVNEKWMYRAANEDKSKAVLGKPSALFTEGDYIVSLQIDDEYGNRSDAVETTVHISGTVLKTEFTYHFTEGKIGGIIDNFKGFNYQDHKEIFPTEISNVEGTMIMSDSPEVVGQEGILYRDKMNGLGRILIHHLNNFDPLSMQGDNRRLVLVAENTSDKDVKVTISNKTVKGPVADVMTLGQKVLYDYLSGSESESFTLKPGEKKVIYDSNGKKWVNGTCISGLMDVQTSGEVTFTTAAIATNGDVNAINDMPLLTRDQHPRGTFDTIAINYKVNVDGMEPSKLLIGRGTQDWVNGYDGITQEAAQNRGNFGISYYITVTATEDTGIILNPRATGFKGAIKWVGEGVYNIPAQGSFYRNTTKSALLGVIKAGETKTFEYMLPNGSGSPILIGFIPKSYWDK